MRALQAYILLTSACYVDDQQEHVRRRLKVTITLNC